jgi:hypothetical protein
MDPVDLKDVAMKGTKKPATSNNLIAIFTSLFALLAAISSLFAGRCTTRGMLAKNEAIYLQSQSSDAWAFFQSRNTRIELINIEKAVSRQKDPEFDNKVAQLEKERTETYTKARRFEADRDEWSTKSNRYLDLSKTFASALAFYQSSIILIPLTLLVGNLALLWMGVALGSTGTIFLIISFIQYLLAI